MEDPILLQTDITNAVQVLKKSNYTNTTKWLDIQYHFVKDCIKKKELELQHIAGRDNVTDIFTKALPVSMFIDLHSYLLC